MGEKYSGPERRRHTCSQETNLAIMKEHIEQSTQAWKRVEAKLNNGLGTQVELNKTAILRAWWWLGGMSLSMMAAAFFIIRGSL